MSHETIFITPQFLELGYLEAPFRKWHKKIFCAGVAQVLALPLPAPAALNWRSLPALCTWRGPRPSMPRAVPSWMWCHHLEVSLPLVVQAALTARGRFGCSPSEHGQAGGQRWGRLLGSVADPIGNDALCSGCSCPTLGRLV